MGDSRTGPPDPVLEQLGDWATQGGLSKEAVAQTLGVPRPTVAGWLLSLKAHRAGTRPPASAREFRFAKQKPEVQQALADVLAKPVAQLLAESTSGQVGDRQDRWAGLTEGSELWSSADAMLRDLALGGFGRSSSIDASGPLRHRIVRAVESVADVAAVTQVAVPRGRFRRLVWQYQIVVTAKVEPPGVERRRYLKDVRDLVDRALDAEHLTCRWEHGTQRPLVDVRLQGDELVLIGSLVCAVTSGSRPPRRGTLLLDGRHEAPRLAVVLSGPFGGSGPIAGQLAEALGVGHVRDTEAVRAIRAAQAEVRDRRGERTAYLSNEASRDAGFMLHQVLYLLGHADMPGAWLLSTEMKVLDDYRPLLRAVALLDDVVVIARSGPAWRRMAAWRMAAATLNSRAHQDDPGGPLDGVSTDWFARPGVDARPHEDVIRDQQERAARTLTVLERWEDVIDELLDLRGDRPTVVVALDEVPDHGECLTVEDGVFRTARMDEQVPLIYPDAVDGIADCWTDAAIEVLEAFAALCGHDPEDFPEIAGALAAGPVQAALGERYR